MRRTVGRPIEKEGRKKIGLSIDAEADKILIELAKKTGKTKSRLFEEAIKELKKREDIIEARMNTIINNENGSILDINSILDKADKLDKLEEEAKLIRAAV